MKQKKKSTVCPSKKAYTKHKTKLFIKIKNKKHKTKLPKSAKI